MKIRLLVMAALLMATWGCIQITPAPVSSVGDVIFWQKNATTTLEIYVDNVYRGVVRRGESTKPKCGTSGFLTVSLPPGDHYCYVIEKPSGRRFDGNFNIIPGECVTQLIDNGFSR